MDRVMVYDGALPQTTDILYTNKFGMVGQAYQNRAILGTSTVVAGLACLPTSPTPDLHVSVGVGSIYQMDPTDQVAFADLGVDNNSIMKQGILASPVTLTITPPVTGGFSQVFLVQAILNDVDAGQTVLSYYNSAVVTNPLAAPFSGPAGSGTSNFTTRTCPCAIALKAGVAATTGTQTTPAPDAGYVGLYAITVANGATQITSGNIVQLTTAPFFPTLPSVPANVQNGAWVYAVDTGAVNALVITPTNPGTTALVTGMGFRVKVLVTNTGGSTITINTPTGGTLGPVTIRRGSNVAVAAGDLTSGAIVDLIYDGVNFQMANYLGAAATTNTNTVVGIPYVADSGTQNAIVATFSPAITAGQQVAGLFVAVKLANGISGATTINVNGLGLKNVLLGDGGTPGFNVFVSGQILLLVYDGASTYFIVNTSSQTYRKPAANTTIFVNGAIGNDANDGVSNTVGHALATIGAGVKLAFSYAPSQFSITIAVANGTYNESVQTPSYAGPTLIIDAGVANVTVNAGNTHCFIVSGPNTLTVKGIAVQNNGIYPNTGFLATQGATMNTVNCASNACAIVFYASSGGTTNPGNHVFGGSGYALFYAAPGGNINLNTFTYTISTSISVSGAGAAVAFSSGNIVVNNVNPPTFVNPSFVNGPKYFCCLNGIISANTLGVNFFPGSVAGSFATGGQPGF